MNAYGIWLLPADCGVNFDCVGSAAITLVPPERMNDTVYMTRWPFMLARIPGPLYDCSPIAACHSLSVKLQETNRC